MSEDWHTTDWRFTNQMKFLFRAKLKKARFHATDRNDHEHCEFCWDEFSELDGRLHEGYCTLDGYRWICGACYEDFKEQFEWQVIEPDLEETC